MQGWSIALEESITDGRMVTKTLVTRLDRTPGRRRSRCLSWRGRKPTVGTRTRRCGWWKDSGATRNKYKSLKYSENSFVWGMVCITSNIAFPRNINWKTKNVLRPYPIMKRNQPTQDSFFDCWNYFNANFSLPLELRFAAILQTYMSFRWFVEARGKSRGEAVPARASNGGITF